MEHKSIKRSEYNNHILYLKDCNYCKCEYWAKKINSNYCSNSCRNLKMMHNKKSIILKV